MAGMFCTLKQAAAKLETTEAEIETLVRDGRVQEFRDGSSRLLKATDVATAAGAVRRKQAPPSSRKTTARQHGHDTTDAEIRLPLAAAAEAATPYAYAGPTPHSKRESPAALRNTEPVAAAPAPVRRPARRPRKSGVHKGTPRMASGRAAARRRRDRTRATPARASARSKQRSPSHEMPLRQWLWMGLLDDEPFAIVLVSAAALLGLACAAGAIYLLARAM